jgi:hypothetical protein
MENTAIETPKTTPKPLRRDLMALWGGILFSLLFTVLIWWAGQRLDTSSFLPDKGASWYFWKLPYPTFWSRATAWGFYLAHQFTLWGIIYIAQKNLKKYTTGLNRLNILALAANAFFISLHFLQTHIWYDGLAQDVSIWSSQVSVIILLVWILLMENQRRGLFAGKKAPISKEIGRFARRYHGYYFAWAIVYTFWYHPMQPTYGHLIGFFYMFLLLLQGSLFFTRIHVNRYWTVVLEFTVLVHGALVAVMQGNGIWPMFAFGFGGMFIITQMHGLGLKKGIRWGFLAAYIALVLLVYSQRGFGKVYEVINIPLIEYLSVGVLALLFGLGLRLARRFRKEPQQAEEELTTG